MNEERIRNLLQGTIGALIILGLIFLGITLPTGSLMLATPLSIVGPFIALGHLLLPAIELPIMSPMLLAQLVLILLGIPPAAYAIIELIDRLERSSEE